LQLIIEKLVYGGDGLARLPADDRGRGKAVFMAFVLPGEQVEASLVEDKPGFARARAEKILQPSGTRIDPHCRYFQRCGGCHYQHASYERQLEIKAGILKENLRRIAKLELDSELKVHPSPPWNYRNRSRLKVQLAPEFAIGYFKFNSHELLPVEECPISSPLLNRAIAALWEQGRKAQLPSELREIELFANAEDTQLLVELHCDASVTRTSAQQLTEEMQRILPEIAGVIAFKSRDASPAAPRPEPAKIAVAGAEDVSYQTEHGSYRVSAGAFFQVNRYLADHLIDQVTQGQKGERALDLYAGVGLFSSVLARSFAQVTAVESSQISYRDLLHNSPANVGAVRANTEQYLQKLTGQPRPDLVVVDPPRSGLGDAVTRSLAKLAVPRMIYVSCDPATLARDLGALLKGGYRVEQAHLLDLFPQTYHMESVFHLAR
jgi:23S rRNA (uracil1939-C5)-methyltransferase